MPTTVIQKTIDILFCSAKCKTLVHSTDHPELRLLGMSEPLVVYPESRWSMSLITNTTWDQRTRSRSWPFTWSATVQLLAVRARGQSSQGLFYLVHKKPANWYQHEQKNSKSQLERAVSCLFLSHTCERQEMTIQIRRQAGMLMREIGSANKMRIFCHGVVQNKINQCSIKNAHAARFILISKDMIGKRRLKIPQSDKMIGIEVRRWGAHEMPSTATDVLQNFLFWCARIRCFHFYIQNIRFSTQHIAATFSEYLPWLLRQKEKHSSLCRFIKQQSQRNLCQGPPE